MGLHRFHIVSLFLSNPYIPSTLSKEAFVIFVCPTEIPQPPFAWKYFPCLPGPRETGKARALETDPSEEEKLSNEYMQKKILHRNRYYTENRKQYAPITNCICRGL